LVNGHSKMRNFWIFISIFCFGMAWCGGARAEEMIYKPYEIENVLVTFFFFDTELELQKYRAEIEEEDIDRRMKAYSLSEPYPDKNICHLDAYVVRPQIVDDDFTTSVGHEVLHCVHGPEYHSIK